MSSEMEFKTSLHIEISRSTKKVTYRQENLHYFWICEIKKTDFKSIVILLQCRSKFKFTKKNPIPTRPPYDILHKIPKRSCKSPNNQ
jgi:hypothetical protein